ncbi:ATPase [Bacteroidia bacterium]|nr:ATPase [Bacteroidia bacterium]
MILNETLQAQIINRLRIDNPWWVDKKIDSYFDKMKRRLYLELFYPLVKNISLRRSIILMGPRRVGKTVMIFHCIQRLIEEGINPNKIIYISIEVPIYNRISLENLLLLAFESLGKQNETDGFYIFYDEIQYLKDWEIHLKTLVDTYRGIKFVASGSASAALKLKSKESGAGRFSDFMLPPLTFNEYIHLKDLNSLMIPSTMQWGNKTIDIHTTFDIRRLNKHFLDYINFGGYPEVVFSKEIQADPGRFIRSDIIDKVLLRDLPSLFGITDVQELNSLFTVIAYHSGNEFSYENLSRESGVTKDLIRKYIEYLEAAFLIKIIHKTDMNAKKFQRATSFKIYLTNPSLRSALFQPIMASDGEIGNMVETTIFAQWIQRENNNIYYSNWKQNRKMGEVDMIGLNVAKQKPEWAVEIKWSDRYFEHAGELKSLLSFMETNRLNRAIVTSIEKMGIREMQTVTLQFIPASIYAYIIGKNTIDQKQQLLGI